jgi:hypothetical protein
MSTVLKQTLGACVGLGVVAAGAWFATLRSTCGDLASLRARHSLQKVALAGAPDLGPDHLKTIADLEARIERSNALFDATPSIDSLYDAIQAAGKKADVRVERLEPTQNSRKPLDLSKSTGFHASTLGFEIEINGDFDRVISFITSIESGLGLSKVTSVRAHPMPGQHDSGTKIVALITTAHFVAVPSAPPDNKGSQAASAKDKP